MEAEFKFRIKDSQCLGFHEIIFSLPCKSFLFFQEIEITHSMDKKIFYSDLDIFDEKGELSLSKYVPHIKFTRNQF